MDTQLATRVSISELGQAANAAASKSAFQRGLAGMSKNTRSSYQNDLGTWSTYLASVGADVSDCDWFADVTCWQGVTHGLVAGFVEWMKQQGFAIATINRKLACVRKFCEMASTAGVIEASALALIQTVRSVSRKQANNVNAQREVARIDRPNAKKAKSIELTPEEAKQLKAQPDTPQGRRDALLMALLLDHGLRAGEAAALTLTSFDLKKGAMKFWRDKVEKEQTHKLTKDSLIALRNYIDAGDYAGMGPLLRGSRKGGKLDKAGLSEAAISQIVNRLGEAIGVSGLSAHDCRHFWATDANRNGTDPFSLLQAGGWTSMQTVQRYIDAAKIANEGVKLSQF